MNERYPMALNTFGEEELSTLERLIRAGKFTSGEQVREFEREFAKKMGTRHAVMTNSGSSANLIATAALFYKNKNPLKRGDEIIVPTIAWATTYAPLQQYGLELRFVDVDLRTLNMAAEEVERAITPKTRAVLAVSVLGNPAPLEKLRELCDRRGLYLIEDNCESLGAKINGKFCGTFGDLGTFSFFFSHQISTMEGGMVVTDDSELYELCLSLRSHGWSRDLPRKPEGFFEAYEFILPGYNVRPLELSGAVGLVQLKKLDSMIETRKKNAALFASLFGGDDRFIIQSQPGPGHESSWFCFTVILNPKLAVERTEIFKRLQAENIEFRIITGGNFLQHPAIRYFKHSCSGEIVNARIAHDRGFFVGNFAADATNHLKRFHEIMDKAVNS